MVAALSPIWLCNIDTKVLRCLLPSFTWFDNASCACTRKGGSSPPFRWTFNREIRTEDFRPKEVHSRALHSRWSPKKCDRRECDRRECKANVTVLGASPKRTSF